MIVAVIVGPPLSFITTGITADFIPSDERTLSNRSRLRPAHLMGTDEAGRDMLARVLQGGRISLMVGVISTFVSLMVGVSYGAIAGYLGGRIDNVMMRIVDIIYAIPYILIVIVLLSVFGGPNTPAGFKPGVGKIRRTGNQGLSQIFLLFFALGLVSWLTMARVVRGQILSLKNQEFVLAAKATGVSTFGIIFDISSERSWTGDRLCDAYRPERDADRGVFVVSRPRRAGSVTLRGAVWPRTASRISRSSRGS